VGHVTDIREARGDYAAAEVLETVAAFIRSGDIESPEAMMLTLKLSEGVGFRAVGGSYDLIAMCEIAKDYLLNEDVED